MHVQSKVTRFMSDYDFSVVGVPSAELTRLRIEGLNHEDNVAVPSSAIRKLFLLLVQVHYPSKTISFEAFGSFGIFFPR